MATGDRGVSQEACEELVRSGSDVATLARAAVSDQHRDWCRQTPQQIRNHVAPAALAQPPNDEHNSSGGEPERCANRTRDEKDGPDVRSALKAHADVAARVQ